MPSQPHAKLQLVRLEDIDGAVHDWLDRTVDAHVESPNEDRMKVPVIFAAGERWVTSRERRGIRDANGVLILPMMTIRRTAINPDPSKNALGIETPNLQFSRLISPKTNDLQNLNVPRIPSLRSPNPVIYEVTTIPFPDSSIMTYELMIQTQFISQMNTVIEKLLYVLDLRKSFVAPIGNHHRHPLIGDDPFDARPPLKVPYVVGFFEDSVGSSDNFEEFTDQERIIKWSTTLTVPAVLQLDPEGERPGVKVERTSFALSFGKEEACFVDDPAEIERIFGKGR